MKREDLKNLELSDEQVDKIMSLHGQSVNDLNGKVSTLEAEKQSLTDQVAQSNKQLDDLKKSHADDEDLQAQIKKLQDANKDLETDGAAKLAEAQKGFALKMALKDAGAKNIDTVLPLLKQETISFEDNKLTGLEEQLKNIQEKNDFLFQSKEPQKTTTPQITAGGNANPSNGGGKVTSKEFDKMNSSERAELAKSDPATFNQITGGL